MHLGETADPEPRSESGLDVFSPRGQRVSGELIRVDGEEVRPDARSGAGEDLSDILDGAPRAELPEPDSHPGVFAADQAVGVAVDPRVPARLVAVDLGLIANADRADHAV